VIGAQALKGRTHSFMLLLRASQVLQISVPEPRITICILFSSRFNCNANLYSVNSSPAAQKIQVDTSWKRDTFGLHLPWIVLYAFTSWEP